MSNHKTRTIHLMSNENVSTLEVEIKKKLSQADYKFVDRHKYPNILIIIGFDEKDQTWHEWIRDTIKYLEFINLHTTLFSKDLRLNIILVHKALRDRQPGLFNTDSLPGEHPAKNLVQTFVHVSEIVPIFNSVLPLPSDE